ncbi:Uncharacterised protein g6160 [Pycnogonum litorale]
MESGQKITLTQIFVYPVKSCAGLQVSSWKIGEKGFEYDRTWMIVDSTGKQVNLKRVHQLYWVKPSFDFENDLLRLHYEDMPSMTVPLSLNENQPRKQAILYGFKFPCYDCGDEVAEWFEEVTMLTGCRLIRQTTDIRRGNLDVKVTDESLSLVNDSQYLIVSKTSVEWLADQLNLKYELDENDDDFWTVRNLMYRFRASMIIEGTEKEFEEERWDIIEICGVKFKMQDQCSRCPIICVNKELAEKGQEPLKSITELRGKKVDYSIL